MLSRLAVLIGTALLHTAHAQTPPLPSCALTCLVEALPQTPCTATNTTCICTNEELTTLVTACVSTNCTVIETLTTKNVTDLQCGAPVRNKQANVFATSIALSVVSATLVILRLGFRLLVLNTSLGLDDWTILATAIAGVPQVYIIIHGTLPNGLGRDTWTLPPDRIYDFGRFLYSLEMQYFTSLMLLKLSLLFFYLKIFPSRGVRMVLWSTVAFVVGVSMLFIFLAIFQCRPISYFWTRWDGLHMGSCINVNAMAWAHAAFSISTDFWMLAIPLKQLHTLNLQWKKKIGVGLMFCVGTFVTIVSILRLRALVSFAQSNNPTWDNTATSNWCTIEIGVGIICACMPSLRVILVHIAPSVFGTASTPQYVYPSHRKTTTTTIARSRGSHVGPAGNSIPLTSRRMSNKGASMHSRTTASDPTEEEDSPADDTNSRIMQFKSYAVEYGSLEDSDQARLVENGGVNPASGNGVIRPVDRAFLGTHTEARHSPYRRQSPEDGLEK